MQQLTKALMAHPWFVSFSTLSSFRQNRYWWPLSLACWTENMTIPVLEDSQRSQGSEIVHVATAAIVVFDWKMLNFSIKNTDMHDSSFSMMAKPPPSCSLILFSTECSRQPCRSAPCGARVQVFMVFSILHHWLKSIRSYTVKIGSLPPLTFAVRWLIGFQFLKL